MAAGIEDEPALSGMARADDFGADAIGGEAALAGAPEAIRDKARGDEALRGLWESPPRRGSALLLLGLCAASGVFAVLCVFAKGALGFGALAVVIGAPVVEETAKVILPMMLLEKEPWRFRGVGSIALICLCSALAFAMIENLRYFYVYIPKDKLTDGNAVPHDSLHFDACNLHDGFGLRTCQGVARRQEGPVRLLRPDSDAVPGGRDGHPRSLQRRRDCLQPGEVSAPCSSSPWQKLFLMRQKSCWPLLSR